MAPPKFPAAEERKNILDQLLKAEQDGTARKSGQHYQNYLDAITRLNALMDQYARIEEPFGIPAALDAAGKETLMNALAETAVLGETFLADVQRQNAEAKLDEGVPGMVGKVQELLSGDFEALGAYDPAEAKLSFPEIQENARTEIIDFRGKKLPTVGAVQSSRLPMSVVDAAGHRRRGFFTTAKHMNSLTRFRKRLNRAAAYFDSKDFKTKELQHYKQSVYKKDGIDREIYKSWQELPDELVIEHMKRRAGDLISKLRESCVRTGKDIEGVKPEEASDELILGLIATLLQEHAPEEVLHFARMDESYLPPKALTEVIKALEESKNTAVVDATNGLCLRLKDGDRLDQRNSAMSAVASLLGVPELIARSSNMKYLDEEGNVVEGTFTEYAKGLDIFARDGGKCLTHVNNDPFGGKTDLIKSIADLQILDYICGNVDRHPGNLTFHVNAEGYIARVQGIDNDASFGLCRPAREENSNYLPGLGSLKVISKSMADKVNSLTPELLRFVLRGRGLKEEEIQAACDRLSDLQQELKKSKTASSVRELGSADGLCVMEREDMRNIPLKALQAQNNPLIADLRNRMKKRFLYDRETYPFKRNARQAAPKKLTEVSTTERKYLAGGIAASMGGMGRAIENKVTGFKVGDLSAFLRSSGKFRDMVSAVKDANAAAKKIQKAIGRDKERLSRDSEDLEVRQQREKADRAMQKVKRCTEAYLRKKMGERHAESYEALKNAAKNPYEQKRINYALKLMKSVAEYEASAAPQTQQAKQEQEATAARVRLAQQREAQNTQEAQQPVLH